MTLPTFDLSGRTALVTGSTRGIGRAIAETFGAAGASLIAHGTDQVAVEACVNDWTRRGWRSIGTAADLSRPDGVQQIAQDIAGFAAPDILVLNASVEILQSWDAVTADALDTQLSVNLTSTLWLIQTFLPAMIAQGWGRVLAIGSFQEERPNPNHLVYAATKAAQTNTLLNLARHTRAEGVTFNILWPGAIETDRNRDRLANPGFRRTIEDRIPLGRIGDVTDCTGAALLLCSEAGAYINGAILPVDGGLRL